MKKIAMWLSVIGMMIFGCCGCIFTAREQLESRVYDLALGESGQSQKLFHVARFVNNSPCRGRMLYRKNGSRILHDEYNRWVQSPENMLQRYLTMQFPLAELKPGEKTAELRCDVEAFEFDLTAHEAVLSFTYRLTNIQVHTQGSVVVREKISGNDPDALAAAMSRAAARAAAKLWQALNTKR